MTKQEVQKRVLLNGKPLDLDKFEWDEKTNTFSSQEDNLVLDFRNQDNCTFKTGSYCNFKTGSDCNFTTSYGCTFTTDSDCTFKTGSYCTFDTSSSCTFDTGANCTFDTSSSCTFKTGSDCNFNTGSDCTFDTSYDCTFKTGEECVIVRRDIFEIIQPESGVEIKLNGYQTKGYKLVEGVTELTLDQIADKFGIPVDQLKIKEE